MSRDSIINGLLELLFPSRCNGCGEYLRPDVQQKRPLNFCYKCASTLRLLTEPLCRRCGVEVTGDCGSASLCGGCLKKTPLFLYARSLYSYEGLVRTVVRKLKYTKDTSVILGLRELIDFASLPTADEPDLIVPVPLHISRLRQRGFNQSLLLAELFFPEQKQHIVSDLLVRKKNSVPQASLRGAERRKSLKNTFVVQPNSQLKEALVCLVDDVYTTGTTVTQCTKSLMAAGAREVLVLTLARVNLSAKGLPGKR
jgi:ComF family protein